MRCNRWIVTGTRAELERWADVRDLGLDRTEEGLVNLADLHAAKPALPHPPGRPKPESCDRSRQGNKLGLEAGWRSQHAADDDAAAYHDRAQQIR